MSDSSVNSTAATFVTVLGWVLIVFTGFGFVTSLMQNVMVSFVFPTFDQRTPAPGVPGDILTIFRALAALMLCIAGFLLFAAWSFLKRRNWARKIFVVLFALGAVWGGFVFLVFGLGMGVFNLMPQPPSPPAAPASFGTAFRVMGMMFGLLAAGFSVLFLWLIKRIRAADVRAEFEAEPFSNKTIEPTR